MVLKIVIWAALGYVALNLLVMSISWLIIYFHKRKYGASITEEKIYNLMDLLGLMGLRRR